MTMRRLTILCLALMTLAAPAEAAKLSVLKGTTSVFVDVFVQDSSSTTGAGLAGLAFNTASLVCTYARSDQGNAGGTAITLASSTLGTYTSGSFKEKDATLMPGVYELGLPTGVTATGSNYAVVLCKGATNMAPLVLEVQLTGVDLQDAVHFGITGIPNAAAGASGGLLISGSNSGTTTLGALTITGAYTQTGATTYTGNVAYVDGLTIAAPSTTNRVGLSVAGNGTGAGFLATGGATGHGISALGGATSGNGLNAAAATSGTGITATGVGTTKAGIAAAGGATTSAGISATGGATSGDGLLIAAATSGHGIVATGIGTTKHGISATGGATTSAGIAATGGATSGDGILAVAPTSGIGLVATGGGTTKAGISATGGATSSAGVLITGGGSGAGMDINAGATGKGIAIATTAGDGLSILPTAGNAIVATANGTSKHGAIITGGTAGTSDGLKLVAGSGGVDMRASITGSLSGSVGSVASAGGGVTQETLSFVKGSTSVIVEVLIKDATTSAGMTGLTSASSNLAISYCRNDQGNAACTAITPASATLGSYTSGGFKEKDATLAPGRYEFGIPTVVLATGADEVLIRFQGVSGMVPSDLKIELVDTGLAALNSKLGTPAGASLAADIAADKTVDDAIKAKTDLLGFTGSNVNGIVNAYASGQAPLQPTTAGRTLLVAAAGGAAVDWANVQAPTTTVGLSGTTVGTVTTTTTATTATTCTNLTNAPTAGDFTATMKTSATTACTAATPTISTLGSNTITAASIATDAITAAKVAADVGVEITSNPAGTYRKNVASQRKHPVLMRTASAPQTGLTGATVAITVSKDGGAAGAVTGSVAELGLGVYFYTPSQADTNCDTCVYNATTALGVPFIFYIFTTN